MYKVAIIFGLLVLLSSCNNTELEDSIKSSDRSLSDKEFTGVKATLPDKHKSDLVWPMPCGGVMAFQKIKTNTEANWLTDIEIRLGSSNSSFPVVDFVRQIPLVGSLSEAEDPSKRYYFIGTYEVSDMQWKSVMQDDCQDISWTTSSPSVSDASWFSAVEFTRRYTEWLGRDHTDLLTEELGGSVFIRLPTEAEWEYAARGGHAVIDPDLLNSPIFPMDHDLNDYVWYAGESSCDGQVRPTGLKLPNPIGLYDILGNAEEIVFEPFRLNAGGRLHGQAGGFITRGGSCLTPAVNITNAYRNEHDFFSGPKRLANKPPNTGFRVAIAAAAVTDSRIRQLENDFDRISSYDNKTNTQERIKEIITKPEAASVREPLQQITADFEIEMVRRNRIEKRSIQSALRSGALTVRTYRYGHRELGRYGRVCEQSKEIKELDKSGRFCELAKQAEQTLAMTRSIYVSLVIQTAGDFSAEDLDSLTHLALEPINGSPRASEFMNIFKCHVERFRDSGNEMFDQYLDEIVELKVAGCKI